MPKEFLHTAIPEFIKIATVLSYSHLRRYNPQSVRFSQLESFFSFFFLFFSFFTCGIFTSLPQQVHIYLITCLFGILARTPQLLRPVFNHDTMSVKCLLTSDAYHVYISGVTVYLVYVTLVPKPNMLSHHFLLEIVIVYTTPSLCHCIRSRRC